MLEVTAVLDGTVNSVGPVSGPVLSSGVPRNSFIHLSRGQKVNRWATALIVAKHSKCKTFTFFLVEREREREREREDSNSNSEYLKLYFTMIVV